MIITCLLMWLVIHININKHVDADTFVRQLADATANRYAQEYALVRSHEISKQELRNYLDRISPVSGLMNPFDYTQFKNSILKAISNSNKEHRAELCFIHDLMIEEYYKLTPTNSKNLHVGVNEFYNLLRNHM